MHGTWVCVIAVVGCSSSSQPTSSDHGQPAAGATSPSAALARPAQIAPTTTCYRATARPEDALRITLDPTHRTIALVRLAKGQRPSTEMFSVHGVKLDTLTKVTTHDGVGAEGKLEGPPWQWTSWTIKRTDARSGDTSTTTFAMSSGGLTSQTESTSSSGPDEHGDPVELKLIDCDTLTR